MAGGFLLLGAHAASAQADIPPVYPSVDENGVDVASGHVSVAPTSISIGPGGRGSLSFSYANANSAQSAVSGSIYPTPGSTTKVTVRIGSQSEVFTGSTSFINDQGGGSTLTFDSGTQLYTYTAADGAVGIFQRHANVQPNGEIARIETLTYPSGERLAYSYLGNYMLRTVASNLGYQLRFIFGTSGSTDGVVLFNMANEACDPAAASCTLSGTWPRLDIYSSSVTDVLGRATQIQYNGTTQIVVTYATSRTMTYNLNGDGRVTSVSDGNGTWTYAYQLNQGVSYTTVTAPGSASIRRVFWNSTTGAVTAVTVGDQVSNNRTTAYVRDSVGRVTNIAAPDGSHVELTYDARGNVIERRLVSATPGTPADIVTTASFPATCANPVTCNQPDYVIDARNNRTDFTYDPVHGGVTSVTLPAGPNSVRPQTRYSYTQVQATWLNGGGTPIQGTPVWRLTATSQCATLASCANGADEVRTTASYGVNDALLPTATISGSGDGALAATTTMTYTPVGDLRSVDGPLSGSADTVRHYYDAARQRTGTIGPDPDGAGTQFLHRAARTTYNSEGQVTLLERGTATGQGDSAMASFAVQDQTATTYNAQGRPTRQSLAAGSTTYGVAQYSYTAAGLVDCVAQRMNPSLFASLPASACDQATPEGAFGPDRIARTTYNLWYEPTEVRTAVGVTGQEAVEVTTVYTAGGQVDRVSDGEGRTTRYYYDGFGRRWFTMFPNAATGAINYDDYERYSYDPNGNLTYVEFRDHDVIGFSYDALNRMVLKDPSNPDLNVTYTHDNLGRPLSVSTSAQTLTFTHDALGRNLSQTSPLGTVSYGYDLAGRRTSMTYPGSTALVVGYSYNSAGDLTEIRENPSGSNTLLATYAYDLRGRRTSLTRGNGTVATYIYDDVDRLTGMGDNLASTGFDRSLTFGHNPAGQIASANRAGDAYAWDGHVAVNRSYTPNGLNQYSAVGGATLTYDARGNLATADGTAYAYDRENRLTSVSGGFAASLAYDPLGRLAQVAGGVTTRMLYDGQSLIAEYDGSNALQGRYVHGSGTDEPLVWYEGSGLGTRRWFHGDERGSVVAVSDGGGAAIGITAYDEYGIPRSGGLRTVYGRFGYTGQQWLPELGLYHYRARAYSPSLGRFLQTDPIGFGGGMNIYAYVSNDPVNLTDPTGLSPPADCDNGRGSNVGACITVTGPSPFEFYDLHYNPNLWGTGMAPSLYFDGPGRATGGGTSSPICPSVPASRPVGTDGEVRAAFGNPFGAYQANEVGKLANQESRRRYPNLSGVNDLRDAYRHFYWVYGMSRQIGVEAARTFSNAHEAEYPNEGQGRDMDTWNNHVAMAMFQDPRYRGMATDQVAQIAIRNGCLRVLR